jgi:hypothetical protein
MSQATSNQFFACHVPRKIGTKVNLHYASYFSSGVRVAYLERPGTARGRDEWEGESP